MKNPHEKKNPKYNSFLPKVSSTSVITFIVTIVFNSSFWQFKCFRKPKSSRNNGLRPLVRLNIYQLCSPNDRRIRTKDASLAVLYSRHIKSISLVMANKPIFVCATIFLSDFIGCVLARSRTLQIDGVCIISEQDLANKQKEYEYLNWLKKCAMSHQFKRTPTLLIYHLFINAMPYSLYYFALSIACGTQSVRSCDITFFVANTKENKWKTKNKLRNQYVESARMTHHHWPEMIHSIKSKIFSNYWNT